MKKTIVFALLFVAVNISAQNDADTAAKPIITAVGKPDGTKTEIKVPKDGSTLKSSDGMVELIIPEVAGPKNTIISIQPIVNLMTNGNGKAYRFEPSGTKFKSPLQIIFHYDSEEFIDSMQLLMGIAMQDSKGQWLGLKKIILDTTAKTVSGEINHFSDWSNFSAIKIEPSYARVKVGNTKPLEVTGVVPTPNDNDDDIAPLERSPKKVIWKVNNIAGGNSAFGTINGRMLGAYYTAPSVIPNQNPVAVTANLIGLPLKFNGVVFKDLRLFSNLLIYDNAYEVKMESKQQGPAYTYSDVGSFIVELNGKNAKMIEKINNNTDVLIVSKCKYVLINPGANHGHIHITGVRQIIVTPAQPPNYPLVEISFISAPMSYSTFRVICPNFSSTSEMATAKVAQSPAMPLYIKFLAKEGEQVIEETKVPGGYYKVTVKQIKDE